MSETLILASWGDPSGWSPVTYKLGDIEATAPTSLLAIAKRHLDARALIIVQETLLAPHNPRRLADKLSQAGIGNAPPHLSDIARGEDYCNLVRRLKSSIQGLASSWLGDAVREVRIGVAPGVGDYPLGPCEGRAVWSISRGAGNPFEYYASTALLHIIRSLPQGGPVTLAIDLTHGVNYTGTALYRAALATARIYSAATHSRVEVHVYNSEPYTPGIKRLRVWRIRSETINPRAAASRLVYTAVAHRSRDQAIAKLDRALATGEGAGREKGELIKRLRGAMGTLNKHLTAAEMSGAAILIGAPLLLLQAGLEASRNGAGWNTIAMAADLLLGSLPRVRIGNGETGIRVEHVIGLSYPRTKSFLAGLALASYARRAYDSFMESLQVESCNGEHRVATPIQILDEAASKFLPAPLSIIAKDEMSKLIEANREPKKALKQGQDLYWRIGLARLCGENQPASSKEKDSDANMRIFAAHAGMNSNIIDVLYRDGRVLLAYSCRALPSVRSVSRSILIELLVSVFGES